MILDNLIWLRVKVHCDMDIALFFLSFNITV